MGPVRVSREAGCRVHREAGGRGGWRQQGKQGGRGRVCGVHEMCTRGGGGEYPLGGFWQEEQAHKLNDSRENSNTKHPPACNKP